MSLVHLEVKKNHLNVSGQYIQPLSFQYLLWTALFRVMFAIPYTTAKEMPRQHFNA